MALRYSLRRVSAKTPFDLIEFPEYGGRAVAAFRLPGVKRVSVRLHSCSKMLRQFRTGQERTRNHAVDVLERWTASQAYSVTSPSEAASKFSQACWNSTIPNVRIIPNPIEILPETRKATVRKTRTVLFSGRLGP